MEKDPKIVDPWFRIDKKQGNIKKGRLFSSKYVITNSNCLNRGWELLKNGRRPKKRQKKVRKKQRFPWFTYNSCCCHGLCSSVLTAWILFAPTRLPGTGRGRHTRWVAVKQRKVVPLLGDKAYSLATDSILLYMRRIFDDMRNHGDSNKDWQHLLAKFTGDWLSEMWCTQVTPVYLFGIYFYANYNKMRVSEPVRKGTRKLTKKAC